MTSATDMSWPAGAHRTCPWRTGPGSPIICMTAAGCCSTWPAIQSCGRWRRGWADRVHLVTDGCPGRPGLSALLVRPDGYVAWAADEGAGLDGLHSALTTWFGPPDAAFSAPGAGPSGVSSASR